MKKIIIVMVMALLVVSTSVIAADLEFNGGVSFNSFDGKNDGLDDTEDFDIDNGAGFFIEGLYPLDNGLKIGGGYDYAAASYEVKENDEKGDYKLSGPYAKLVYSLQNNFDISAGLAYYKAKVEPDEGSSIEADGLGYLLGVSYTYPIKKDMNIVFGGDYRLAKLDMDLDEADDAELDSSGFRLSAALNYSF